MWSTTSSRICELNFQMKIRIEQTRDLKLVDQIVNDPKVYAGIADDKTPKRGELTMANIVQDPRNIILAVHGDEKLVGCFILLARGVGVYEVHTCLLPACRGRDALTAARRGMDYMFMRTDAGMLCSYSWSSAPAAGLFARLAGMVEDWKKPAATTVKKKPVDVTRYSISLHEWLRQAWPRYQKIGALFHEQLFKAQGFDNHPEDPNHDGMLGLVLTIGTGGLPDKAEAIYNRWAAVAGYAPAKFLYQRGGTYGIDITNAIVEVNARYTVTLVTKRGT